VAQIRLHVHGMDCAEETSLIRRALAATAGITDVEFDLINAFVDVTYDPQRTSAAEIFDAVQRTGLAAHETPESSAGDRSLHTHAHHYPRGEYGTLWIAASGVFLLTGWAVEALTSEHWFDTFVQHQHDPRATVLYILAAATGLWPMWPRALASVRYFRLDMHVLVCVCVIGAAVLGEWSEGATVAFLFALAHRMESWSIERARAAISALVSTGSPHLAAGSGESAEFERFIERFAAIYTPAVTGLACIVAIVPPAITGEWALWFYRALVFLVLGCPCALVISTPVTVVAALSSAARHGVLIKGGAALERAAHKPRRVIDSGEVVFAGAGPVKDVEFLEAHARRALNVIRENVAIALLTKLAFLGAAPFGVAPLWLAVLADTGATVVVTLNALRLLRA